MTTTSRATTGAVLLVVSCAALQLDASVTRPAEPGSRAKSSQKPPQAITAPLPVAPITQIDERLPSDVRERPFSLSIAEPMPIKALLLMLVRETTWGVVIDPDVTEGTFTGELKNVTLRQALDAALKPLNLTYSVEGKILHVSRRQPDTRLFHVNYVAARSADFFDELAAGVRTLLSQGGTFNLDRKAGVLQATDYPDRLDRIATYVDAVVAGANRQVRIHAIVIEVELHAAYANGLDWPALFAHAGGSVAPADAPAAPPGTGSTLSVRIRDLDGLLRAFETQGTVNVLSRPRVTVMNNERVVMRMGTEDVYFGTTSERDAAGHVSQSTVAPHAIAEGVMLTVTPQAGADGVIQMAISPTITQRTGEARSRLGDLVPIVSVREADTVVRTREGETVVIAGLMQPATEGKGRTTARHKTELVVLLTATAE
jgi:type II secretory pathway component GspD/PulD (secretin)